MELEQILMTIAGTGGLSAIIVAIINKCPNFKIKKKKKKINYSKTVKRFEKLLEKSNLPDDYEFMVFIILNMVRLEELYVYKCDDNISRCITDIMLKNNYLRISNDRKYKWNMEQEELGILLDYYDRLSTKTTH